VGFHALRAEADAEDIRNVARLEEDWRSGAERFRKTGEILLAGFDGQTLVAIGGLTVEPDPSVRALRLRRLYVRPAWRKRGIGRALATALMDHGFRSVNLLTLNAGVPGAAEFWEALGFQRVEHESRTHEFVRPASGR
jgi:GNAT superfamily N-acetyltransferase